DQRTNPSAAEASEPRTRHDDADGHARPQRGVDRLAPVVAGSRQNCRRLPDEWSPGPSTFHGIVEQGTMFRFAPYVIKSLYRHRARTLLTVSGAAVALFVFCFVGSVQQGLHRLTEDRDAQRTLIVFQENRFCPTSSRLPQDYADRIRKIAGVADVIPIQVWTNNCRASLDVVVFNGIPAQKLQSARDLKLLAGNWGAFTARRDAALVGRNVAQRRNLKVGGLFSIGDISVNVVGIFASPLPAEENLIYTNLEFLQ